ncbi:2697_t:CDS:2 [Ambispora gerdemannii]|uniref:2697_t:CDS:1 n=1 Tax=Ambispora gerdemannii TaxID=144530 RepID=A0A9N8YL69_9GLOM|nr:2697_t:CDS:2 [Ambispora gerdemannii]
MKYTVRQEWFLIYFDDARQSLSTAYTAMAVDNHVPEIPLGAHDKSVDTWSVDYLITSMRNKNSKLDDYAQKLYADVGG